ncbi:MULTISPECIES: hypothetical protein [Serratia]|uniref:hypothetical protein n=1 Tax=Serratia TaxID=613 RepID=UPI001EF00E97|nr:MULTISPECIES: hypothetical protein [Serratia]
MLSVVVSVCLLSVDSVKAIEVFPIIKEVKSNSPRDNYLTVKSNFQVSTDDTNTNSDSQQYEFVTLELYSVINPGFEKERLEKVLTQEDPEIIYSPSRMVVPYGEERKVRLMPLKAVDVEKVYRLRIRPSYPEHEIDKGKVRFAIGYDVLLRYLPEGKHTTGVAIRCNGDNWEISATGNVRSELRNLVIDGRKDKVNFNVYPTSNRSLHVKHNLAFEMDKTTYRYQDCRLKE